MLDWPVQATVAIGYTIGWIRGAPNLVCSRQLVWYNIWDRAYNISENHGQFAQLTQYYNPFASQPSQPGFYSPSQNFVSVNNF